ncbi:MAG: hypothetical protein VKJ05_06830 [Synechococcaceae cyanobacterium]|nr:hypothetical protein [Synechococcaceae cyanobacterium]
MSFPIAPLGPLASGSADDGFQPPALGLLASPHDASHQLDSQAGDPVEAYFECITTCSLEDGECVTQCVEILRENG